jgi:beta-phosphoglucomutase-like phosphatase (HAD superfamily)
MMDRVVHFHDIDADAIEVLLCDADGNLFASEEPAFVASTEVTNRLLASLGIEREFTPDELRRRAVGRNFRSTALDLAAEAGTSIDDDELESWVREEQHAVVAELGSVLRPDPAVDAPLRELATRFRLAVVSSSAHARLDACFRAAGLDELLPPSVRFSAEDSLPAPASKPDPAIYTFAGERLGIGIDAGLAVEDATAGALSAVAAGFTTVGNLQFVPPGEREQRASELREAGVAAIVSSWSDLAGMLGMATDRSARVEAALQ